MTAARRLAAILAVDVAGYSRMMGEDEAGTALAVRDWREAEVRHRSTLDRFRPADCNLLSCCPQ
jgi:hypothetical protein